MKLQAQIRKENGIGDDDDYADDAGEDDAYEEIRRKNHHQKGGLMDDTGFDNFGGNFGSNKPK